MLVVGDPLGTHPCCPEPVDRLSVLTRAFLAAVLAGDGVEADACAFCLDRVAEAPGDLRGAALWYALRGWPVFPLAPGGKTPLIRGGFRGASTDARVVGDWWKSVPESNIGCPTGATFDVVDIDYHSHPGALRVWSAVKHKFTAHGVVSTPRGIHYYVPSSGMGNGAAVGGIPGLDYRGKGGYVVLPPSRRPDGRYLWWSPPSPDI
jgi:hypothetical protein